MAEYDDSFGRNASRPRRPRKQRGFGRIAAIMGVLGLISLPIVPVVFVAGMFSVIGIPVAAAALVFPTLCFFTVLAYFCWRVLPLRDTTGVIAAFLIAAGLMTTVPLLHNWLVMRDVNRLTASDVQSPVRLLPTGGTLAVLDPATSSTTNCDDLCVDLLLSGQVRRYVRGYLKNGDETLDGNEPVRVHELARGGGCAQSQVSIRHEEWKAKQYATVAHAYRAAKRNGVCIRSSDQVTFAELGTMTVVTFFGKDQIDHAESPLFIDTMMRPYRFAVQEKTATGLTSPVHQQTIVSYKPLKPVLAYAVGTLPSSDWGLWREDRTVKRPELKALMSQAFGFRFRAE